MVWGTYLEENCPSTNRHLLDFGGSKSLPGWFGALFPEDFYRGASLKHTFILQFQEPYNPSRPRAHFNAIIVHASLTFLFNFCQFCDTFCQFDGIFCEHIWTAGMCYFIAEFSKKISGLFLHIEKYLVCFCT